MLIVFLTHFSGIYIKGDKIMLYSDFLATITLFTGIYFLDRAPETFHGCSTEKNNYLKSAIYASIGFLLVAGSIVSFGNTILYSIIMTLQITVVVIIFYIIRITLLNVLLNRRKRKR